MSNRGRGGYGKKRRRDEENGKGEEGEAPQTMVPKAASRNIGGMRNDDGNDDLEDGKDEFGVKDVRAALKLKTDHNSR